VKGGRKKERGRNEVKGVKGGSKGREEGKKEEEGTKCEARK
jgi:hypothetical protein